MFVKASHFEMGITLGHLIRSLKGILQLLLLIYSNYNLTQQGFIRPQMLLSSLIRSTLSLACNVFTVLMDEKKQSISFQNNIGKSGNSQVFPLEN